MASYSGWLLAMFYIRQVKMLCGTSERQTEDHFYQVENCQLKMLMTGWHLLVFKV
jgi:hypothetical protein